MNASNIKAVAVFKASRAMLLLKKNSPEIMLTLGISGGILATVLACRATIKAVDLKKESDGVYDQIEHVHALCSTSDKDEISDAYTEEDYQNDIAVHTVQTIVAYLKLYAPALIVGGISIGLIVGGHRILNKRNAALATAYAVLDTSYRKYRERVKNTVGEEQENAIRYGDFVLTNVDENGEILPDGATIIHPTPEESEYTFWFQDETSTQFRNSYEYNKMFLLSQEKFANMTLKARGHLFLNEVLRALGMEDTRTGAITGWVWNKEDGLGDDFVDFGLLDPINIDAMRGQNHKGQPINGPFFLNFNVDGLIYNII